MIRHESIVYVVDLKNGDITFRSDPFFTTENQPYKVLKSLIVADWCSLNILKMNREEYLFKYEKLPSTCRRVTLGEVHNYNPEAIEGCMEKLKEKYPEEFV